MNNLKHLFVLLLVLLVVFMVLGCGLLGKTHTLTVGVNDVDGGLVHIDPPQDEYLWGTVVELTAVPSAGWHLLEWDGDASGTDEVIKVKMNKDKLIIAVFDIIEEESGFAGGDGTEEEPYLIGNAEQLSLMRDNLQNHFKQIAHINLKEYDENGGWVPIGEEGQEFSGFFDGNGFEIINLTIDRSETNSVGLFGYLSSNAVIRDVALEAASVTGKYNVGALAGVNSGTIKNSYAVIIVEGNDNVGGLVGLNSGGEIKESFTKGQVTGGSEVGGLVGDNPGGLISHSYSEAEVHGGGVAGGLVGRSAGNIEFSHAKGNVEGDSWAVGGLVGHMSSGNIEDCYVTGDVLSYGWCVGGLVGSSYSSSSISRSYATGNVTAEENSAIGGLVGNNSGDIADSYARGEVTGQKDVGGFAGINIGEIVSSYATGKVTGDLNKGGLVGKGTGHVFFSYWDIETSEQPQSAGGYGRSTEQMKTGEASKTVQGDLMYEDWDETLWNFGTEEDYPYFIWQ